MFQDIGLRLIIMGAGEFRRNISSAQTQVRGLANDIERAAASSMSMTQRLDAVGSAFMRTGQLLTTHLTIPLAILGGSLIASGIQFEDAFAGVSKTVDGVSDDMGNLTATGIRIREEFRKMALEIPLSVNEFARIGELAGQLGITADEIEEFTRTVALLGVTTSMTSEDAATFFARLGNIMGVAASDMAEFTAQAGSTVVDLGNKFAATEPEIATLSLRLAGAGQAAGLSTPQILALATAMASMGIQAEMGGSAVSRILLETKRAVDDFTATGGTASDQLVSFAKAAQLTVAEFVAMQKADPNEVFLRLVGGFNRMSEAGEISNDVLKVMNLDTIRLQDVLNRLGPNIELVRDAMNKANIEWAEGDALQKEANKRFNTTKSQLLLLRNSFVNLGIEIFYLYAKPLNALIKGLKLAIDSFTEMDDGVIKSVVRFALFAATLGPILSILGTLLVSVSALSSVFAAAGGAMLGAKVSTAVLIKYVSGLAAALVTLAYLWKSNFLGIKSTTEAISKALSNVVFWLGKAYDKAANFPGAESLSSLVRVGKGLAAVFEALTYIYEDNTRTFFGEVLKAFGLGEEAANTLGMTIRNFLVPIFTNLGNGIAYTAWVIDGFIKSVKEFGLGASIAGMFEVQDESKLSWIGRIAISFGLTRDAAEDLSAALAVVYENLSGLWGVIAPILVPFLKLTAGFLALKTAAGVFGILLSNLAPLGAILRVVLGMFTPFMSVLTVLSPLLAPLALILAGVGIAFLVIKNNLFGIGDLFNTIVFWVKTLVADLFNLTMFDEFLRTAFNLLLSGDLGGAWEYVKLAVQEFLRFIETGGPLFKQALDGIWAAFVDVLSPLANWIMTNVVPLLTEALTALINWIVKATPVIIAKLLEWAGAFIEWVTPMIPKLVDKLEDIAKDVIKWVGDKAPEVLKKLEEWGNAFVDWVSGAPGNLIPKLGDLLSKMLDWAGKAVVMIVEKLLLWGVAFLDWLGPVVRDILPELGYFLGRIIGWIASAVILLVPELAKLAYQFIVWVGDAIIEIGPELGKFLQAVLDFFLYTLIPGIITGAIGIGKGIIDGVKQGIGDNWESFKSWVTDLFDFDLVGGIKDRLGVGSPSKVFAAIGKDLILGLTDGMSANFGGLETTIAEMANKMIGQTEATINGHMMMSPFANVGSTYNNTSSSNRTNVFSPTINGAVIGSEERAGEEIARVYRMAQMGAAG